MKSKNIIERTKFQFDVTVSIKWYLMMIGQFHMNCLLCAIFGFIRFTVIKSSIKINQLTRNFVAALQRTQLNYLISFSLTRLVTIVTTTKTKVSLWLCEAFQFYILADLIKLHLDGFVQLNSARRRLKKLTECGLQFESRLFYPQS